MDPLEWKLHRAQLATKRIEHEAKPFKRRGAEEWIVTWFSHDDHRIPAPALVLEGRRRQPAADHIAIGEHEFPCRMGLDTETTQDGAGNQGIHRSGIDKASHFHRATAVRGVADLDAHMCQAHVSIIRGALGPPGIAERPGMSSTGRSRRGRFGSSG
jgi:hypothetical protein